MSHFFALAIVTPEVAQLGHEAISNEIGRLMEPYFDPMDDPEDSKGYWDDYKVGGAWDGLLTGGWDKVLALRQQDTDHKGDSNAAPTQAELERNLCLVRNLPEDETPLAIVTPDGRWHSQTPRSSPAHPDVDWKQEYRDIRELYADCLAIGLDCHI